MAYGALAVLALWLTATSRQLFAICSHNFELLLNFFLARPPYNHCHVPLTHHAEIGLALIKTVFGRLRVSLRQRHARHVHGVLKRNLSVRYWLPRLVSDF